MSWTPAVPPPVALALAALPVLAVRVRLGTGLDAGSGPGAGGADPSGDGRTWPRPWARVTSAALLALAAAVAGTVLARAPRPGSR